MGFETEIDKATPLVSVIVPVYNTEEYLDRCVESLLGLCDIWVCRDRCV